MAFDFNALLEDPKFVMGLSLLGGANQRNAPLQQVATQLMAMKKSKKEEERLRAQMEQDAIRNQLYEQQIAVSKQNAQRDLEQQQRSEQFSAGIMDYLKNQGIGLPGMGGQPQPMQQQPVEIPQPQPQLDGPQMGAPISNALPQGQPIPQQGQSQQPLPPPATPAANFFRNKIIPQESGGKQFRSDGTPLLSTAGAVGIAQVMPTTGPEAAKLAGLPWDKSRLYADKDYNQALGEAYFTKQLQDFGREDYAAAAYNAGPQRVRQALAAAEKANRPELWTAFLPKETQDYVKKTSGTPPVQPKAPPLPPQTPLGLRNPGTPLILAGALGELQGIKGASGLIELGKSMEPKSVSPGSYQVDAAGNLKQVPDPLGERRVSADEGRLALEQQKVGLEQQAQKRLTEKATKEMNVVQAKDKAAYDMVSSAATRMENAVKELSSHKGLNAITGLSSVTNRIAIPGQPAYNALADLKSLTSKIVNDTLQAVRQASANGASGYGSFTEQELEVVKTYVASLDTGKSKEAFLEDLKKVQDYAKEIKTRAAKLYEESTGNKVPALNELPPGAKQIGTQKGKKVYELPNGDRFIEE